MNACACGRSVLYMTVTTWLENVALARSSGTYLRYRDKVAKPDVLILDDMGMRKLTSTEAQDLCEILEERSNGKSTVFTTQLPLDHWSEVIPDPVIADATIPHRNGPVVPGGRPVLRTLAPLARPAPAMIGRDSRNENRVAASRSSPSARAAVMVTPDRDTAGCNASACASPRLRSPSNTRPGGVSSHRRRVGAACGARAAHS